MQYYINQLKEKWLFAKAKKGQKYFFNKQQASEQPIFIVSSGRAGTTLLRKLLMQGEELHIPPESADNIPKLIKQFVQNRKKAWEINSVELLEEFTKVKDFKYWDIDLMKYKEKLLQLPKDEQTFYSVINYIYQEHALKYQGKEMRWGDKTPYLVLRLKWLKIAFPNAVYIHLMRDGRDVVSSRMKSFGENLEQAANRWLWSIKEVEKHLEGYPNFKEIRYEYLVSDTETTLKEICQVANLRYSDKMLDNQNVDLGDDVLAHHKNLNKEVNRSAIAKWKKHLSEEQIELLKPMIKTTLEKKGYQW